MILVTKTSDQTCVCVCVTHPDAVDRDPHETKATKEDEENPTHKRHQRHHEHRKGNLRGGVAWRSDTFVDRKQSRSCHRRPPLFPRGLGMSALKLAGMRGNEGEKTKLRENIPQLCRKGCCPQGQQEEKGIHFGVDLRVQTSPYVRPFLSLFPSLANYGAEFMSATKDRLSSGKAGRETDQHLGGSRWPTGEGNIKQQTAKINTCTNKQSVL